MSRAQKSITVVLWVGVVVGLGLLIAQERWFARGRARPPTDGAVELDDRGRPATTTVTVRQLPPGFAAPAFDLVDQQGRPFSSDQLKGKVWTAMLFFSRCGGVCPSMTRRISELQAAVGDDRVHFVSFTVDPENDTPETLAAYAAEFKADPQRWHLLTGTPQQMHAVAAGFKLPFDRPADHSSKVLLIDGTGRVQGLYGTSPEGTEAGKTDNANEAARLRADVAKLLAGPAAGAGPTP